MSGAFSFRAKMLMCHKVTHKNLIDSSPLFRNSQIKIYVYATKYNIFCLP